MTNALFKLAGQYQQGENLTKDEVSSEPTSQPFTSCRRTPCLDATGAPRCNNRPNPSKPSLLLTSCKAPLICKQHRHRPKLHQQCVAQVWILDKSQRSQLRPSFNRTAESFLFSVIMTISILCLQLPFASSSALIMVSLEREVKSLERDVNLPRGPWGNRRRYADKPGCLLELYTSRPSARRRGREWREQCERFHAHRKVGTSCQERTSHGVLLDEMPCCVFNKVHPMRVVVVTRLWINSSAPSPRQHN